MDPAYLETLTESLRNSGVRIEPGLTDVEVAGLERTYCFRFPAGLRSFLQHALPLQHSPPPLAGATGIPEGLSAPIDLFPDWRRESDEVIRWRLDYPLDGILFDIEYNGFWLEAWGEQPTDLNSEYDIARRAVAQAPTLIPVCGHRYLPAEPLLAGNPVLSVVQTDIIHYGYDLAGYFAMEWGVPLPKWAADVPRRIRFWDDVMLWNSPGLAEEWAKTDVMRAIQDAEIRRLARLHQTRPPSY